MLTNETPQPAVGAQFNAPVRPVSCWYCGIQMHYAGHPEHEPEVRLHVEHDGGEQTFYLHARCWNDWQLRRPDSDEYEVGYAHGIRDARAIQQREG